MRETNLSTSWVMHSKIILSEDNIRKRIYGKYEEKSGNAQFGFKNSLRMREALYCMQLLV